MKKGRRRKGRPKFAAHVIPVAVPFRLLPSGRGPVVAGVMSDAPREAFEVAGLLKR